MSYLVDTNVFSEPAKPQPDLEVVAWLQEHEAEIYVSSITIGEIRRGIERLPEGHRKALLRVWLAALCAQLRGRRVSFNTSTAHVGGQLKAGWERAGISVPTLDSQLAATAHRYGLTVVTRNVADFSNTGVKVLNPFSQ